MHLPPFQTFPTLTSQNIVLREVLPEDIPDVLEISVYDGRPAADAAEALTMFQKIDQNYRDGNSVNWGIADKTTNEVMGTCGFYRGFEDSIGELGCIMRPAFRGRGYMTEAMRAAMDFGFREMELTQIFAVTRTHNVKAMALMDRLGFLRVNKENVFSGRLQEVLESLGDEQVLYVANG